MTEENNLITIVKSLTGIELSPENDHLITKRLIALKQYFKIDKLSETEVKKILSDPTAQRVAISLVTNNETAFYRDILPFKFLLEILENNHMKANILSLPASTGQEPYSIAMTICENDLKHKLNRIDAMDIDESALEHSIKNGYFKFDLQRGLSEEQISKNFVLNGNKYFPIESLLEKINFKALNILSAGLNRSEYDITFLRNLLIYFDNTDKQKAVDNVVLSLKEDGVLILGNGERINHISMKEMFWNGLRYYIKESP